MTAWTFEELVKAYISGQETLIYEYCGDFAQAKRDLRAEVALRILPLARELGQTLPPVEELVPIDDYDLLEEL